MIRRRDQFFVKVCVATVFTALVGVVNACAAEEGAAANQNATTLFQWINFAIVAGIIGWVFLKVTPPLFRKKADAISSAIATSTAAKAEAERQLREAQEKLAKLEQEVAQLRQTAQSEAVAEAARIRKMTEHELEKIDLAAQGEIEAAARAARIELKAIAANLAVDGAESLVVKQLTPQVQESLVANFVKSLEGRPN